jgi:hypothetical protein
MMRLRFNGTFTLTQSSPGLWSSPAITGCPGQTVTAYLKYGDNSAGDPSNGFGVTGPGDSPGSGDSDFSPWQTVSCSPLQISGGGSQAGNINQFCPGVEDVYMNWSLSQ